MLSRRIRPILIAAVVVLTAISAACACSAQSTATLTQIVNPIDPGLVWATPAAIPFGTPLDASNLNATARTGGSFLYDPAAGAILTPGSHTLSVRFQPDNPNFRPSTASVVLQVLPPGDSTFDFQLGTIAIGGVPEPIVLRPGHPAMVTLSVRPIRDFHQPVTFSCGRTEEPLVCVFSPDTIRPVKNPIDVVLTISLGEPKRSTSRSLSSRAPPGPLLCIPLSLLGALIVRRGRVLPGILPASKSESRSRSMACRFLILVIALPLLAVLSGCSWGANWNLNKRQLLPITASSLVESRTLELPYVILPR